MYRFQEMNREEGATRGTVGGIDVPVVISFSGGTAAARDSEVSSTLLICGPSDDNELKC